MNSRKNECYEIKPANVCIFSPGYINGILCIYGKEFILLYKLWFICNAYDINRKVCGLNEYHHIMVNNIKNYSTHRYRISSLYDNTT